MKSFSLQELACLDAVVAHGSFHAAAAALHRTHPAVHAAVKALESRVGTALLDRSGYRVALTEAGRAFCTRARELLADAQALDAFASHLARGDEPELTVVVGDLCPLRDTLRLLRRFFDECPHTQLHLHFEALAGPGERLADGGADLMLHHVESGDTRFECTPLFDVTLVPVVAPDFLPFPLTSRITPRQMKSQVQCIVRDSARKPARDYFVLDGARSWTVADQFMKKELIAMAMGWGHMPLHLVQRELRSGQLLSLEGRHFKRSRVPLVAARVRGRPAGPVAQRLWGFLSERASAADAPRPTRSRSTPAPAARGSRPRDS
jgi:DNA-binding transcriptional LysR family regulator